MGELLAFLERIWGAIVPWQIVREYERGVLLRCGRLRRELEPGIYLLVPVLDEVLTDNIVPSTTVLPAQSLETADGVAVVLSVVISWSITDATKFLTGVEGREHVIRDAATAIVGRMVAESKWETVRAPEFARTVRNKVAARARRFGAEIEDLGFATLARCQSLRLIGGTTAVE